MASVGIYLHLHRSGSERFALSVRYVCVCQLKVARDGMASSCDINTRRYGMLLPPRSRTFEMLPREVFRSILSYGLEDVPEIVATCCVVSGPWPDIFDTYLKTPFLTVEIDAKHVLPCPPQLRSNVLWAGCLLPPQLRRYGVVSRCRHKLVAKLVHLHYFFQRREVTELFDGILMLAIVFCDTHVPSWRRNKLCRLPTLLAHLAVGIDKGADDLKRKSVRLTTNLVRFWFKHCDLLPDDQITVANLLVIYRAYCPCCIFHYPQC